MPIATPEVYAEMIDKAKAGPLRLPRHQRQLLADPERRPAGLHRGRLRRHRPGVHRRRRVRLRPHGQEHGLRQRRARGVRARGGEELPGHHRPAHRPLSEAEARRLRPPAARDLRRAGQERREPALPVPHVGRLRRAGRGEPGHRRRAAGADQRGQDHLGDRGRRRRRRGGRRHQRDQRQALHHRRGRSAHDRGARHRREGPLHHRPHLRQRARGLQARARSSCVPRC